MLYSLVRFGLEFLRGDYAHPVFLSFTSAQTTSIITFILALSYLFIAVCKFKDNNQTNQTSSIKSKRRRGK